MKQIFLSLQLAQKTPWCLVFGNGHVDYSFQTLGQERRSTRPLLLRPPNCLTLLQEFHLPVIPLIM